jgi:putative spermidine/putrescine transport system permease protein/spermidine/putrescine transport system permease protein
VEEVWVNTPDKRVLFFRVVYGAIFVFFLTPVVVIAATSLSPSVPASFPPESVSLRWYAGFLGDGGWKSAVGNSLLVAATTSVLAVALGASGAYGLRSVGDRRRKLVLALAVLPLGTPLVVVAVSLLVLMGRVQAVGSYAAVVVGHTVITAPLALLITYGALSRVDWSVRDSALDLGARPVRAFKEATLPQMKSAVVASAFVAAVLSMHEFLISLFLTDFTTRTVPVLTWITLRNLLDPTASVVSTLLVVGVFLGLGVAAAAVGLDTLARDI